MTRKPPFRGVGRFFAHFFRDSGRFRIDNPARARYNTTILKEGTIRMRSFNSAAYFYFTFIGNFR